MKNPTVLLRNTSLDALKGALLIIMSVNHLAALFPGLEPGISHFYWTFGIFSVALAFVFLSGVTTSMSLGNTIPFSHKVKKLLLRIRRMYLAHLVTTTVAVISIVLMAENPVGRQGAFQRIQETPLTSWFEIATFLYCPLLLDIIPLYCFLFIVAGAVLPLLDSKRGRISLLIGSCTLWGVAQYWTPTLGSYTSNFIIFHPLAWQLLFVVGLLCGATHYGTQQATPLSSDSRIEPNRLLISRALFLICAATSLFFFNQRHRLIPSLTVPWSWLHSILGMRSKLSLGSLINIGVLSYTLWWLHARAYFEWRVLQGPLRLMAWLGKRPLEVFTWNISLYYVLLGAGANFKELSPLQQALILSALTASCCIPLLVQSFRKLLVSHVQIGGTELTLCMMAALIPIAYIPDFGVPYREIKNVLFWIGAAGIALYGIGRKTHPSIPTISRPLSFFIYSGCGLILLQVVSLLYSHNVGEGLIQLFTVTSSCLLMWSASRSSLTFEKLARWLLIPTSITTLLTLSRTYCGVALTPAGAGLGGLVGERNSSAILLAQTIPFILILSTQSLSFIRTKNRLLSLSVQCGVPLLTTATFLATVLPRSRTAWAMLAFTVGVSIFFYARSRSRVWQACCGTAFLALLSSALVVTFVPTKLKWSSQAPYVESLHSFGTPIEHSNGRDQLWKVGAEMFKTHPLLGVGAGNYPVVMKEYVSSSGAIPHTFGFLRRDLPLFNDYLQAGVELGIIGGILYFCFFFGLPVWVCRHYIRTEKEGGVVSILGTLSPVAIALAGCVDYPFHRAENIVLFSIVLGISLREIIGKQVQSEAHVVSSRYISIKRTFIVTGAALLSIGTIMYGLSFGVRSLAYKRANVHALMLSWSLWPWDSEWDERYGKILLKRNEEEALTDYISKRLSYWPTASTTWITLAESARARGAHSTAAHAYLRALFEVPGGRCNFRAKGYLDRYLQDPSVPSEIKSSLRVGLMKCPPF